MQNAARRVHMIESLIKKYLKKYKQDLMPAALVIAGIILLLQIIIPQFGGILEVREEIETQAKTNDGLRSSINALNAVNDAQLDSDYTLVLSALPPSKSIGAIYNALSLTALSSNVAIGSLNLQVGSIYELEEDPRQRKVDGVPFLNLLVRVNGNSSADATRFAQLLYQALPLVEINSIAATSSDGRYDVDFFFKPINTKSFQAQTQIQPLNTAQQQLLTTLRSWEK